MTLFSKFIKSSVVSLSFVLLSTQLMPLSAFCANTNQNTKNNQATIIPSEQKQQSILGIYSQSTKDKTNRISNGLSLDNELSIDNENSENSQISEEQAKLHKFLDANSIENSTLAFEIKNSLNKILEQNNATSLLVVEIKQAPIEDIVLQVDEAYKGKVANVSYIKTNIATNSNSLESNFVINYATVTSDSDDIITFENINQPCIFVLSFE